MSDSYLSKTGLSYFWSKLKLAFAALVHVHASSDVTLMTGYSKPSSSSAISASDTLNQAVGKLEKAIDDVDISNVVHRTGDETIGGLKTFNDSRTSSSTQSSTLVVANPSITKNVKTNDGLRHYTQLIFTDSTGSVGNGRTAELFVHTSSTARAMYYLALSCYYYDFTTSSDGTSTLYLGYDEATGSEYARLPSTSSDRTEGTDVVTRDWIPKDTRIFQRADAEAMGLFGSADPPSLSGTTLDMNDIVTPGVYYVNSGWTTAHLPYDTMSNGIVVVYTRGTNYLVKQIIYRQGTINANDWQTFVRMGYYNSGTQSYDWSDWHRYATWMENEFYLRGTSPGVTLRQTKVNTFGTTPASNAYTGIGAHTGDGSTEIAGAQFVIWTTNNVTSRLFARANQSSSTTTYAELIARTGNVFEFVTPTHRPDTDNKWTLGDGTYRWKQLYASTATINTSDERFKASIASVPDEVLDAWGDVGWVQFRFVDAVAEKGDAARLHGGLIAQRIDAAFRARGLDASAYGLFCYDEWDAVDRDESVEVKPAVLDDAGNVAEPAVVEERHVHVDAGDMYSLRYEEAFSMEAAYMRRENALLKKRVSDLEERLAALELKVS